MNQTTPPRRYAVLGGGISGLAAAHRLLEIDPHSQVTLYETSERVGGVIETVRRDGYLIERSAESFLTSDQMPWARQLCERIGFAEQLIPTDARFRGASVVFRGRLVPLPEGFTLLSPARVWPVLTTPLLSLRGKLRLAWETMIPKRTSEADESLADFSRRRLGRETYERIVQPLVGGIYTADPEQLSMMATMRQFVELERKHGSLIRGARRRAASDRADRGTSGARYNLFVTPRDGLSSLVAALAARLPSEAIRLGKTAARLTPNGASDWRIDFADGSSESGFAGVVVAMPAAPAASILSGFAADVSRELAAIPYAGASVVVMAFGREQFRKPFQDFGFVVPLAEKRRILAGSYSSIKFPGRAPDDAVLLRVFVGGALQSELAELDDASLERIVQEELADLLGIVGAPRLSLVNRWRGAMPQYHVGHLDRVARIEAAVRQWPGLALAGSAYRGVGIPYCIRSGEQAAERIYAAATNTSPSTSETRTSPLPVADGTVG